MTTIKEADEQRAEILAFALQYDPEACWMADPDGAIEPDENCLLVAPSAVRPLIEHFGDTYDAYEDPNPPDVPHTRVVFPGMAMPS